MRQLRRVDGMVVDTGGGGHPALAGAWRAALQRIPPVAVVAQARSFVDLTRNAQAAAELAAVYRSVEGVDLTVGLHADHHRLDSNVATPLSASSS